MQKNEKPILLAAIAVYVIFGFSFIFSKMALNVASASIMLFARFVTAFVLLSVLWACGVVKMNFRGKNVLPLVVLGLLQPILYFIGESYGMNYTTASFAGLMIAMIPVVSMALAAIFLRERPTVLQIVSMIVSVAGVVLITALGGSGGENQLKGVLLLLLAVVSGSAFTLLSRKLSDTFNAYERTYVMFVIGVVFYTGMAFFEHGSQTLPLALEALGNGQFVLSILYLAGLSSVAAFILLNEVVSKLSVTRTSSFSNLTAVVSFLAGVIFLREPFSVVHLVGSVLIIGGVYGVNRVTEKK